MVTVSYIDKIYSQVNQNVFLIFKSAFCTLNNVFTPGHLPTLIEKKEGRGAAFIPMRMNANGCKMFVFLGCCTLNKHKFRKGEVVHKLDVF